MITPPQSCNIGLKEWAHVAKALSTGDQIMLLRKGGIHESAGEFEIEHRQFVLFPTYLHQNINMLKPDYRDGFSTHTSEPTQVIISVAGVVSDIIQIKSRQQLDLLNEHHIWTAPLLDMRWNYRQENPLYVLIVRAYCLPEATLLQNTPAYAGCKSWVPLDRHIDCQNATPVWFDDIFDRKRQSILGLLN